MPGLMDDAMNYIRDFRSKVANSGMLEKKTPAEKVDSKTLLDRNEKAVADRKTGMAKAKSKMYSTKGGKR